MKDKRREESCCMNYSLPALSLKCPHETFIVLLFVLLTSVHCVYVHSFLFFFSILFLFFFLFFADLEGRLSSPRGSQLVHMTLMMHIWVVPSQTFAQKLLTLYPSL